MLRFVSCPHIILFQLCWFNSLCLLIIHSQTYFKLLFINVCSANVSFPNLMKLTGNNSIDGILGQCNCSDFVCLMSYGPRYVYICVCVCGNTLENLCVVVVLM